MKAVSLSKLVLSFLLLGYMLAIASQPTIPQSDGVYQFSEIEPDLVEIKLIQTGEVRYKNTSTALENTSLREVPEMIIDVESIDYDSYADMYTHWQDIHAWDPWLVTVGDTDQDGLKEIIASRTYSSGTIPTGEPAYRGVIYELTTDNDFHKVLDFPDSTNMPFWSGDLDGDGSHEVLMRRHYLDLDSMAYGKSIQNYEGIDHEELASNLNFTYQQPLLSQINHPNLLDLDDDGITDLLYYMDGGDWENNGPCPRSTIVAEYDSQLNTFVRKYCFGQPALYTSHYAIGDWDGDGYTEFATGGLHGEMYIMENNGPDSYELVYEDTLPTSNAYMTAYTADINGNGRPELWIGGDGTTSGTKIYCYESPGNNEYELVYQIRLPGLFSFYPYGIVNTDINLDGEEELAIWTCGYIIVLENTGPESYEIRYAHHNVYDGSPLYKNYYSLTVEDLSGDGYPEILISGTKMLDDVHHRYTEIHRPSGSITDVSKIARPTNPTILRAYPNPFNRSITISWQCNGFLAQNFQILDIQGRAIRTEHLSVNSTEKYFEYHWDATDENGTEVSSGVYFISVADSGTQLITKVVLIK